MIDLTEEQRTALRWQSEQYRTRAEQLLVEAYRLQGAAMALDELLAAGATPGSGAAPVLNRPPAEPVNANGQRG